MTEYDSKILPTVLLALGIASGCSSVDVRQCGDAEMIDHGWNAYYPRFEISLPTFDRDADAGTTLRICEAPDSELALRLVVLTDGSTIVSQDEWSTVWSSLEASGTSVEVRLTNEEGVALAEFAAPLAGGWTPSAWGDSRFFRASELSDLQIDSARSYELNITMRGEVPDAIRFKPMLVGGGKDSL